jgi:predicted kinase
VFYKITVFGSPCPVILRPQDGYYTVVGAACVYSLMSGEAMEKLAAGEYKVQEFDLH